MTEIEIRENLIKGSIVWYPFEENARALLITGSFPEFGVLSTFLADKKIITEKIHISELDSLSGEYDYIISALSLESSDNLQESVGIIYKHLSPDGKLLILADNRLAIRYFCGDKDLFSKHVLDGVENYISCKPENRAGRGYSKAEWRNAIVAAGFENHKLFGVFPSIFESNIFIRDGYNPNENMAERIQPYYESVNTVFLDEKPLFKQLQENDMLTTLANSFFIECVKTGECVRYNQVTVQGNRAYDEALVTYIEADCVTKKPMWKQGFNRIISLQQNTEYLSAHGVIMADSTLIENELRLPYIQGPIATEYLQKLLVADKEKFFKEFDRFVEAILRSSEHIPYDRVEWEKFDPDWERRKADDPNIDYWKKLAFGNTEDQKKVGVILERGYIDLTTINCIHHEGEFVFFDQEFYVRSLPANALIYRAIIFIYAGRPDLYRILPLDEVLERYYLKGHEKIWARMIDKPLRKLLNEDEMAVFHRGHRPDYRIIRQNRLRMDYCQEDFERFFGDIFKDVYSKKCYVFGSGAYAKRFLDVYGSHIDIAGIVDNNSDKWGQSICGIEIHSPDALLEEKNAFKVFICIKYYEDVLKQLYDMGIRNLSVYDSRMEYPVPRKPEQAISVSGDKPYHIGYVAGVFDLFHMGHVNLLRRAKEQCDYLIVGVVTDEQVMQNKKTRPYQKFEDRLEIIRSCKYVDEGVEIPLGRSDTEDAYQMYRFDVQFSGSDYENDPAWLAKQEYLRQRGSELVFFPYTESVSSTKLKQELKNRE